jgi:serine/threonine protein kinase
MAGTRIGAIVGGPNGNNFELTEFLGAGAFGEVYRAENKENEIVLAVKLLPLPGISDPALKQALLNEAALATQVHHPNVVNVLHAGDNTEVGPYLLMEYVSGQTLKDFLHSRTQDSMLGLGKAIEIMLQIAQGARAINDKLVHRDIKPDNIIISGNRVKITDFGLSKLVTERTRTLTFKGVGPIRYMAPEAWQLQQNTPKMDIYSVGLVFYEILTLQHPLQSRVADASHIEAWRKAHLFESIGDIRPLRGDIPRPLAQLLSRMVAKRSTDRPEWDEIIAILSSTGVEFENSEDLIPIVEKAIAKKNMIEKVKLDEERKKSVEQELNQLYQVSFEQLVARWDKIIDLFNAEFQGGSITKDRHSRINTFSYLLPHAPRIIVSLFPMQQTEMKIAGGNLMGGGFIGIDGGVSANILLIKESPDDMYGKWVACLVKLSAMVDPRAALSRLSRPPNIEPFGFQSESDYNEHIKYAGISIMHIFIYELKMDLDLFFRELLETAYSM